MGSETTVSLPVIDFSIPNLKNSDSQDYNLVKSQVQKAIEEFGCFIALRKVPEELRTATFESMEDLFSNVPLENKKKNVYDVPLIGYTGHTPSAPPVENLGFIDPTNLERVESITKIFWPQGNPDFSKTIQSFSSIVYELQKEIRKMILENLGLEKYLDDHMSSTEYALKLKKYDAPNSSQKIVGIRPHSDITTMTILYDNQVEGLEVQTKDGQWIFVKTAPDTFIVFIGESFSAWTNGRLYAAPHQVTMTGFKHRFSIAFLTYFKEGYMVKTPEELVDEEHPLLYGPFDYVKFLKYFTKQLVLTNKLEALKDYAAPTPVV